MPNAESNNNSHNGKGKMVKLLTLYMFSIVFNGQLVQSFFSWIILDADGTIPVVLYRWFVHISSWHLDFGCTDPNNTNIQFFFLNCLY